MKRPERQHISAIGALILAMAFGAQPAHADVVPFGFSGNGFSASGFMTIALNVAPVDPDPNCGTVGNNPCRTDPAGAYTITGITGVFSDPSNNIFNAAITGLVPIDPANERDPIFDPKVPSSLSFFDLSDGTAFSYSNLYYPAGSSLVCTTFPFTGTLLDVFGVAFTVDGGYTVDVWGDGDLHGPGTTTYGLVVTDGRTKLADQFDGLNAVSTVPEPGTFALLGIGLVGMLAWRKRATAL